MTDNALLCCIFSLLRPIKATLKIQENVFFFKAKCEEKC